MSFTSGVFPVYDIDFKIGTKGLASTEPDMKVIKNMESFSFKIDGKTDSWTPMDSRGWLRQIMTGKSFAVTLKGKRDVGDPGNDYCAKIAWADGLDCSTICHIVFPNGDKLEFNCVIDVSNPGGDDSTKVAPLDVELKADGKPNFIPAGSYDALALSSSTPAANATAVVTTIKPALTFNNAISDYSGIMLLNLTDGVQVPFTAAADSTGKIITITPTASLTAAKKYGITLADVHDIYGQELANTMIAFTCA